MSATQTIIINITHACNYACAYCYNKSKMPKQMSIDTLSRLILKAFKIDANLLHFIWIGGEPLIIGIEFFKIALELQKKYSKQYNIKYKNSIQTNGSLINHQWVCFFTENNYSVGFSLDGPEQLHNKNRKYHNKKPTYHDSLRGYTLFREFNKQTGILSVIDDSTFPYYTEYALWIKSIKCSSISFNIRFDSLSSLSNTNILNKYKDFLHRLNLECQRLLHKVVIRELTTIKQTDSCSKGILCAYNHCAVDIDGTIYFCCDRFIHSNRTNEVYSLGNINNIEFREIFNNLNFKNLVNKVYCKVENCQSVCKSVSKCLKVCPANLLIDNVSYNQLTIEECPNSIEFNNTLYNKVFNEL